MNIEQTVDGIEIGDLVLRQKTSKYEQTKIRVTRHYNNRNMSDKEIIELLADEIEEYRNRIRNQEEYIKKLQDKQIQSEVVELDTTDEIIDDNIKEMITTNISADGKVIQTIIKYKYKEDN